MRKQGGVILNKDGSIDLRHLGPFNVDRDPSGRLVPKGSIANPIASYPESKTKLKTMGEGYEEEESLRGRSKNRGKTS